MSDPRAEISHRIAAHRAAIAKLDRRDAALALGRLASFVAAAFLGVLAYGIHRSSGYWLLAPLAAFVALAVHHDRIFSLRSRARRAIAFHERALSRLDGRIEGSGAQGEAFADPAHPYALDLDLFGRGSLFELICTARTLPGEERLASWLLRPGEPDEIRARQRAVVALAPRLELREDLAVLGEDMRAAVDARKLAAWGEDEPIVKAWLLPVSLSLAGAAVAGTIAWIAGLGPFILLGGLLAEWAFARALRQPVDRVLSGVERPAAELEVVALLLARLEREPFEDARLSALKAALLGPRERASRRIAALERNVSRIEWAKNQLFAPIAFALAWTPLHAALVERWRRASGARIRGWLDAAAELEALSSLAGYAFEHPQDPFPEILDADFGPERRALVDGEGLAHPLLPGAVPNDVRLGLDGPRALLVSGSNMSGKSTFLRTLGVNVVLALAGAPVRAVRLRLTPLETGATLRIQDSLQAGRSRFYAEIERLKELSDLADRRPPLLFLLDEILHGTNSHDRRIGAEAVVRGLVSRGAIGVVTTHDLALTELAGSDHTLANAHFEDEVRDGQIAFDYRLRPGVVSHSNALALMRAIGLRV